MPARRDASNIRELISDELRDEFGRYRRQILQPGGSQRSIMQMLTAYLGREPSAVSYLEMLKQSGNRK
jgi:Zn-dependent oligopeptidase